MRAPVDVAKLTVLMREMGRRARGPGTVYLTGGATALLLGWRDTTVDVDIKLEPEPAGIFEAIAGLKNELDINIELASPDLFIPPVPGWESNSLYIAQYGDVSFRHYDLRAQALAKLARGHDRDLRDVEAMLSREHVSAKAVLEAFDAIRSNLVRYPGLNAESFADRVRKRLGERDD